MARPRAKPTPKRAESYRHEEEALLRPEVGTQARFKKKPPKTCRSGRLAASEEAMSWRLYNVGLVADRPTRATV